MLLLIVLLLTLELPAAMKLETLVVDGRTREEEEEEEDGE